MKTVRAADHLIIFSRYPEIGTTKTRLIPALGAAGAAALQRQLTEQTVTRLAALAATEHTTLEICHEGGNREKMALWLGNNHIYTTQKAGDLGRRMQLAFSRAFMDGSERVILVGADCPELSSAIIVRGLAALTDHDLVLGPATDGGYYLIGLRRLEKKLFNNIRWGGDTVLATTLNRAKEQGLTVSLLQELNDLDRPADLAGLKSPPSTT